MTKLKRRSDSGLGSVTILIDPDLCRAVALQMSVENRTTTPNQCGTESNGKERGTLYSINSKSGVFTIRY